MNEVKLICDAMHKEITLLPWLADEHQSIAQKAKKVIVMVIVTVMAMVIMVMVYFKQKKVALGCWELIEHVAFTACSLTGEHSTC